jgi:hypothetical protein
MSEKRLLLETRPLVNASGTDDEEFPTPPNPPPAVVPPDFPLVPLPANPKGSHYDGNAPIKQPLPAPPVEPEPDPDPSS